MALNCDAIAEDNKSTTATTNASLVLEVSKIKVAAGNLMIAIYATNKGFPNNAALALRLLVKPANASTMNVNIGQLPAGRYAVAIIHDSNSNDVLDKNTIGYPTEQYGFSNNASGIFGPPSFDQASFVVADKVQQKVKIALK